MKKFLVALIGGGLCLLSSQGYAKAEVDITWQNPEDYSDVRPTNESRKRFRERTFRRLDEYINELSERFPEGQKLEMTVTNLDLAGQVWPASFVGFGHSGSDVRLVKRIDIPRMNFSYKLTDASGALVKEGEVKLKDMGFQDSLRGRLKQETLQYEKNMIREWFDDEFPKMVVKN